MFVPISAVASVASCNISSVPVAIGSKPTNTANAFTSSFITITKALTYGKTVLIAPINTFPIHTFSSCN